MVLLLVFKKPFPLAFLGYEQQRFSHIVLNRYSKLPSKSNFGRK
jgi:hypothetical protein